MPLSRACIFIAANVSYPIGAVFTGGPLIPGSRIARAQRTELLLLFRGRMPVSLMHLLAYSELGPVTRPLNPQKTIRFSARYFRFLHQNGRYPY